MSRNDNVFEFDRPSFGRHWVDGLSGNPREGSRSEEQRKTENIIHEDASVGPPTGLRPRGRQMELRKDQKRSAELPGSLTVWTSR